MVSVALLSVTFSILSFVLVVYYLYGRQDRTHTFHPTVKKMSREERLEMEIEFLERKNSELETENCLLKQRTEYR